MKTDRRGLLQRISALAGVAFLSAGATVADPRQPRWTRGPYCFAEGVASADPRPDAVMLWTRVTGSFTGPVALLLQVATDEHFGSVILERSVDAVTDFDHTIRAYVDGLAPNRYYWFRFLAPDGSASRTGRTRTALHPDDPHSARIALFSCQHYESGFFTAYRRLIADEEALGPQDRINAILHVGDFIYDNAGGKMPSQDGPIIALVNPDGIPRKVPPYPSGGRPGGPGGPSSRLAVSLDDYRLLYRTYLSDPDLQDARALYPFIQTWDDHEFTNDSWQGFSGESPLQKQRYEASHAWFEYCPAMLAELGPPAHSFRADKVENTPVNWDDADEDFFIEEPNNVKAASALCIYRTLRLGRHLELIVTDCRSCRGPRGLDDALLDTGEVAYPASPIPPEIVRIQAAGRTANGGNPPDRLRVQGRELLNSRQNRPATSMLGKDQEEWARSALRNCNVTWRALVVSTPLMRFGFDMRFREPGLPNGLLWTDGWDGYPQARESLVSFIEREGIANVVSLSGDRHAHFAGTVRADYDDPASRDAFPEFVCTGASSYCRAKAQAQSFGNDEELIRRSAVETGPGAYTYHMAPTLNAWLLHGGDSAGALGPELDRAAALRVARDDVNTHLTYADTDAYGYTLLEFGSDGVAAEFVSLREPLDQRFEALRRAQFEVGRQGSAHWPMPRLVGIEGTPPLMGLVDRTLTDKEERL